MASFEIVARKDTDHHLIIILYYVRLERNKKGWDWEGDID